MRIDCLHGYFLFSEDKTGELSRFMSIFPGFELVPKENLYTFGFLLEAESYSIAGASYLNLTAVANIEGKPWDVMRENGFVFDFQKGRLVPILSVLATVQLSSAGTYSFSSGLLLPGSVRNDGKRVTDYAARFSFEVNKFKYTWVGYE